MWHESNERRPRGHGRGFSLIEVLIAAALFTLVMAGVYLLYTTMQDTLARGEMKSDLQQNARVGLDRLVQELRMAGYDPENALATVSTNPYHDIRAAGDSCVSFVTYRSQTSAERTVQVTYWLSGGTLRRREDSWSAASRAFIPPATTDAEPLAESVSVLNFTYYDASNRILRPSAVGAACPPGTAAALTTLDDAQANQVRRVAVTLRTLQNRTAPESYTLTSYVYLRNR